MDPTWIPVAFVFGLAAKLIGLPPLVGFLIAGFVLHAAGVEGGEVLDALKDTGVTLLLFTIGLKLRISNLLRPEVWAGATIHMLGTIAVFVVALLALAALGLPLVSTLDFSRALLLAFALSFSSTVFAIKVLEAGGDGSAFFGRTAIGILIMQDVYAVLFLALAAGAFPSPWSLLLLLLIPLRPVLYWLLDRAGHGELLILLGALLGLGLGYALFDSLGVKGDLGALLIGILLAPHAKAAELSRTLLGFKDLFLVAFFLDIGMSGGFDAGALGIALALTAILPLKVALYLVVLTRFRLRARSALRASLTLANYSEFGLIVMAVAVQLGWLPYECLLVLALAVSLSFILAAPLNTSARAIAERLSPLLGRLERADYHEEERPVDLTGTEVAVVGMGRVGTGAYDEAESQRPGSVIGIDRSPELVRQHLEAGRRVAQGDVSADTFDHIGSEGLRIVLVATDDHASTLKLAADIAAHRPEVLIAATARFDDEIAELTEAGAHPVFNLFSEAGAGLASHALEREPHP